MSRRLEISVSCQNYTQVHNHPIYTAFALHSCLLPAVTPASARCYVWVEPLQFVPGQGGVDLLQAVVSPRPVGDAIMLRLMLSYDVIVSRLVLSYCGRCWSYCGWCYHVALDVIKLRLMLSSCGWCYHTVAGLIIIVFSPSLARIFFFLSWRVRLWVRELPGLSLGVLRYRQHSRKPL